MLQIWVYQVFNSGILTANLYSKMVIKFAILREIVLEVEQLKSSGQELWVQYLRRIQPWIYFLEVMLPLHQSLRSSMLARERQPLQSLQAYQQQAQLT